MTDFLACVAVRHRFVIFSIRITIKKKPIKVVNSARFCCRRFFTNIAMHFFFFFTRATLDDKIIIIIITVSGSVFFFVHDGHAVGGGRRRRGTRDASYRPCAGRSGSDAAVVRVRVFRQGCPSVGRRIASADRRRRRRLLVRLQCSQLWKKFDQ